MVPVFDNREFALFRSSVQEETEFCGPYYFSNNSYSKNLTDELKSPSVKSFIRASTTGNSVKCLAVYLNLTNACQTLDDVSKVKAQVPKIALVTLVNESSCTLQELAENVQNAGYSVLIYFAASYAIATVKNGKNKLLIPVAIEDLADKQTDFADSWYSALSNADLTYVEIFAYTDELMKMEPYLKRLYFWFLIGPLITLEWMRRTRKFCWMSDSQDDQRESEERTTENESEIRTMEEGENGTEESSQLLPLNYQGSSVSQRSCEKQPLLDVEYTRQPRRIGRVKSLNKFFYKGVLCFSYLILIIAALPIGISSGGYSFFRFDDSALTERHSGVMIISFLSDLIHEYYNVDLYNSITFPLIVLLWSPIQIFCFLLYSRLACTTTWVVPINFLKLIRSDWFASNISLLVLAVVVPLCTSTYNFQVNFVFFASYNAACTMCNVLFVIILNKHKFVTRYVFYISVCMIFAYLESSIVAVFYFVLNSEGSLNNLKLTALRTVAIGLTLKVSFSSSMHIIRKLNKPVESLFEGLSEK